MTSHPLRSENANTIIRNNVDPLSTFKTTQLRAGDAVSESLSYVNVNTALRQSQIWTPTGDIRTLRAAIAHRIQIQGSHRTLERLLIGPVIQGEPPFHRQDIQRTCSVPVPS